MRRELLIESWFDRKITPGSPFDERIEEGLRSSQIVLLLISADFLASEYCAGVEMRIALEMHQRNQARVIPVILRPCDWRFGGLERLLALPADGKPVGSSIQSTLRVPPDDLVLPKREPLAYP